MKNCILIRAALKSSVSNEMLFNEIINLIQSSDLCIIVEDIYDNEFSYSSQNELAEWKDKLDSVRNIRVNKGADDELWFTLPRKNFDPRLRFKINDLELIDLSDKFLKHVKYLFINSYVDSASQNSKELDMWEYYGLAVPEYAQLEPAFDYDNPILKEINLESLPGHDHQIGYGDYLLFSACSQMYFSDIYYKYIPKFLFDEFKDCEENSLLDNGLRKIILYKDLFDFQNPLNKNRQMAFRKKLGIDTIAHELQDWSQVNGELPVVISKENCEKGQTKVIRYLSASNELVSPSLAFKREIKEYLEDGTTIVHEKTEFLIS